MIPVDVDIEMTGNSVPHLLICTCQLCRLLRLTNNHFVHDLWGEGTCDKKDYSGNDKAPAPALVPLHHFQTHCSIFSFCSHIEKFSLYQILYQLLNPY